MSMSFRTIATLSFSALVGFGVIACRTLTSSQASAEPFQPIKEAEMPRGFPTYTPVGQIEVKQYPAYRKASATGVAQFWTLFRHIQRNDVKMTAPVEMDYGEPNADRLQPGSMAFLYEGPDQGSTGTDGRVEVSDVPAETVVSIGCRGDRTPAAVAEARDKLLRYLEDRKDEYTVAGALRVMGYNSPFVPRDKNFFEVQIPVKATKAD